MNTGLINGFKSKEKALAWAVIEQAIIDYRATNCQQEKDEILEFLRDVLPKHKFLYIVKRTLL